MQKLPHLRGLFIWVLYIYSYSLSTGSNMPIIIMKNPTTSAMSPGYCRYIKIGAPCTAIVTQTSEKMKSEMEIRIFLIDDI